MCYERVVYLCSIEKEVYEIMRKYFEVIEDLKVSLNYKSTKLSLINKSMFMGVLNELNEDFKIGVSVEFLRDFVKADTDKAKNNHVSYLLKSCGYVGRVEEHRSFNEGFNRLGVGINELDLYKSIKDSETGEETIYWRTCPLTSHDGNGIKNPCSVGIVKPQRKLTKHYNMVNLDQQTPEEIAYNIALHNKFIKSCSNLSYKDFAGFVDFVEKLPKAHKHIPKRK